VAYTTSHPTGYDADLSPPCAEIKHVWSYTTTPSCAFMGQCLIKHRCSFCFSIFCL